MHNRPLIQGTVTQLPFADASAALLTSFDVLYCLDDASEQAAVREMWRVLRPGGLLLVNVAALEILHGSHSTLTMEVRRYTKTRLRQLLAGAGFMMPDTSEPRPARMNGAAKIDRQTTAQGPARLALIRAS